MQKYFDPTFWKVSTEFCVAIVITLVLLIALGYYNDRMYGPAEIENMQRVRDQQAQSQAEANARPQNFTR